MKKKRFSFDNILHVINIIWVIFSGVAIASVYIPPKAIPYISLMALAMPIFIILNIVFVIYWIVRMKRFFLTSVIAIVGLYSHIQGFYKVEKKDILLSTDLKVMSYNVHMFSDNKWSNEYHTEYKSIEDFIHQKDPDILCLQEYNHHFHKKINFRYQFKNYKKKSFLGQAIFSKYKIVKKGSIDFPGTANNAIFADVIIKKERVRIYNLHLQSLNLNTKKENFGLKNQKVEDRIQEIFIKQAEQVALIKKHMASCDYPIIIMGDFNNTAFSYNYRVLKEDRKDAFNEAGIGFGETYRYDIPLRIDHILVDESFEVHQCKTYKLPYSDHYPISARIHL